MWCRLSNWTKISSLFDQLLVLIFWSFRTLKPVSECLFAHCILRTSINKHSPTDLGSVNINIVKGCCFKLWNLWLLPCWYMLFLNHVVIKLHFKRMNNTRLCASYCAWIILIGSWIYVYLLSVSLAHCHIQSVLPSYSLEGYNNDIGCSFKIHLQDKIKVVAAVISNMLSKVWVVICIYGVINTACSEYINNSVWHFKKSH